MSYAEDDESRQHRAWQQERQAMAILSSLSDRTDELDRREAPAKLGALEWLAAIGEFAAIIMHEIRHPLTTIPVGLKSFKQIGMATPAQERLAIALDKASRLDRLLSKVL